MSKGNSTNIMVLQQIALEGHQTHQMVTNVGNMVKQIGDMSNEQKTVLQNLIALTTHLNCMLVSQLEIMEDYVKADVVKEYMSLCKQCGIKPLIKINEREEEDENDV